MDADDVNDIAKKLNEDGMELVVLLVQSLYVLLPLLIDHTAVSILTIRNTGSRRKAKILLKLEVLLLKYLLTVLTVGEGQERGGAQSPS